MTLIILLVVLANHCIASLAFLYLRVLLNQFLSLLFLLLINPVDLFEFCNARVLIIFFKLQIAILALLDLLILARWLLQVIDLTMLVQFERVAGHA